LHDLDAADQYKRNRGLRKMVEQLIWKGISAAQIYAGLSGVGVYLDGPQQLYDAGGKYIQRTDINNWACDFKTDNPDHRHLDYNKPWEIQVEKTVSYLNEVDWLSQEISCKRSDPQKPSKQKPKRDMSHGIVYAAAERLIVLRRHGSTLVTIDSTHKMCYLRWYLYTLIIRDSQGSFIPCGHLLTDGEDSEILSIALWEFKWWCRHLPTDGKCCDRLNLFMP
jgi:hypothetical protein